jgi:hypothetical protein
MNVGELFLTNVIKRFESIKKQGENSFNQIKNEEDLWKTFTDLDETNSIAVLVNHLAGNMISRWTNIFIEDGEKPNRNRPSEFDLNYKPIKEELQNRWEEGWKCLFDTLNSLKVEDLNKEILIRKEPHVVIDAILRQLVHYSNHVGQLTLIVKTILRNEWNNLSIPKDQEIFDYKNLKSNT